MIEFLSTYVNVFTVGVAILIAFGLAVASEAVHNRRIDEAFDRPDYEPADALLGDDYRDHVREFAAKKARRQRIIKEVSGL